jgi:hypothetical protein
MSIGQQHLQIGRNSASPRIARHYRHSKVIPVRVDVATRAHAVVNYERAVVPFLETDRLSDSERAMLMGGACAKAYRWSPKKG